MKLKIVCPDPRLMPTRSHPHDAGLDLRCALDFGVILRPGERHLVDTGVAVNIPAGYVGLVHPRSGWAHKYGITVNNAPGTVDAGYTGNVRVNLINRGQDVVSIGYGERIAQLIVQRVELPMVEIVDSLDTTARGTAGHGSTGTGINLEASIRAATSSPKEAEAWEMLIGETANKLGVAKEEIIYPILRTIAAGKATLEECKQLEAKGVPLSDNFKNLVAAGNANKEMLGIALTTFIATGNHEQETNQGEN